MSEEEWKDVIGFEGLYKVSNLGNVCKVNNKVILKPFINYGESYCVKLSKNKIRYCYSVHRLVAGAFLENPNNKTDVDHIDRNRLNNNVNNLRWATRYENMQNREIMISNTSGIVGVISASIKQKNGSIYYYWKAYIQYTINEENIITKKTASKYFRYSNEEEEIIAKENAIKARKIMELELHPYRPLIN